MARFNVASFRFRWIAWLGLGLLVLGSATPAWTQTPSIPTPSMVDRFDFWNNSGSDTVGSATLSLSGGATISGGALNLGGVVGQYASISGINGGNGVSALSAVTFEGWGTYNAATGAWSRLFDFGGTDGGGNGYDYIGLTVAAAATGGPLRAIFSNADPGYSNETDASAGTTGATGSPVYTVVTFDNATNLLALYLNGSLVASNVAPAGVNLSGISNQYAYLGKSLYNGDSPLNGSISEFRVWNGALSPATIAAHALAGGTSSAQLATWNGSGDFFANSSNWSPGLPNDPVNTSIVVAGGTLSVSAPTTSNYIGTTILSGGVMSVYADNELGAAAGEISLNGGVLSLNGNNSFTSSRNIILGADSSGNMEGTVQVNPGSTATLSGQTISGITGGAFFYTSGGGTLNVTGPVVLTNGNHFFQGSGAVVVSGTGSISAENTGNDIGYSSGNTPSLTLSGSSSFLSNGGDFNIGDTTGTGITATVNVQGNATLSAGNLYVGKGANTGILNISGGVLNVNDIRTGDGDGNGDAAMGTTNQTGGVANLTGWFRIGEYPNSAGVYNFSSGTINDNLMARVGEEGSGTLNVSGNAVFNIGQDLTLGLPIDGSTPGSGVVNISGGSINVSGRLVVGALGGTGSIVQTGGSVVFGDNDGESRIGGDDSGGASIGSYQISAGTLTVNGNFQPGADGTGTLIQTGGVINSGGWHSIGRFAGGVGVETISGGVLNLTNTGTHLIVGEQGTGTLTVSGTGVVNCVSDLWIGLNYGGSPGNGTVNLNGGVINTSAVTGQGGTSTFNFNGGTLNATVSNTGFMQNLTSANVEDGGAVVNTNGNNIVISQALLAGGTGIGGLTKIGAGTLGLTSGGSTYGGPTTVAAGTLLITGNPALLGAIEVKSGATLGSDSALPAVTVDAGGTFAEGYTFSSPVQIGDAQPASLTTAPGAILSFKLSNSAASGNDQITAAGSVNLAAGTIINVSQFLNSSLQSGSSYDLITAPSITAGTLALTGLPLTRQSYSLVNSGGTLMLDVSAATPANLIWQGGLNGNAWDVQTTKNWYNTSAGQSDYFYNFDNVIFNDSGSSNGTINLTTNVQPGSVTFSMTSASSAYTLTGTGGITGATGLVMTGSGSLTIANPNSYTGETDIHGGSVIINAGGSLGDPTNTNNTYIAGPAAGDTASLALNSGGTLSGSLVRLAEAAGSSGTLTQTGGVLVSGNWLNVGGYGTGLYNFSGGTATNNGEAMQVPTWTGTGTVNMSGNAVLNANAYGLWLASDLAGGQGFFNQGGNSVVNIGANGGLDIGRTGTGNYTVFANATINMSAGGAYFILGDAAGASGTFVQSGSSVLNLGNSGDYIGYASVGAGGTGSYTLTSGTLNAYTDYNFNVGDRSGSTGTMYVNGGVANLYGGFTIGKSGPSQGTVWQAAGQINLPANGDNMILGYNSGAVGSYYLNGGTLNTWDLRAGGNNDGVGGTGTITQTGGVANVNGWLRLGEGPGAVGLYSFSGGTINANLEFRLGEEGSGTMNISGASVLNVAQDITMGLPIDNNTLPGNGTFNLTGSALVTVAGSVYPGNGGGTGSLNIGGNAMINLTGGGNFDIGDSTGGAGNLNTSGTVTQTGGTITLASGQVWVSNGGQGSGAYNMSGGVLNAANWIAVGRTEGTGVFNMSGGTVDKTGGGNIILGSIAGNGTWNMNGGLVLNNSLLILGESWVFTNGGPTVIGNGNFYLNGGTVQATGVSTNGAGTGNFYFNGGILQASAGNGNYLANNGGDYIQAGGAIIDSNGNTITISSVLAPDPALVGIDGGLTKQGAGWLTLTNANNTYTGGTRINGGVLQVPSDGALGAVPANEQVNITINNGGELYNDGGQLTLNANRNIVLGPGTQYLQPGWGPSGIAVNGQISGSGSLAVAWDGGVLALNNSNSYQGSTTIGSTAGPFYWNNAAANVTLQLGSNDALPGTDLVFGSDANNNTATLDMNGYSATVGALTGGTNAVIDDVNGYGTSVLTVGNNNAGSTFGGTIRNTTGSIALEKIGTGTLVLSGSDTYSGGTIVSADPLVVSNPSPCSTGRA